MPQREDYLIRMIRQAFDVLRRLRAKLMGDPLAADAVARRADGIQEAYERLLEPTKDRWTR